MHPEDCLSVRLSLLENVEGDVNGLGRSRHPSTSLSSLVSKEIGSSRHTFRPARPLEHEPPNPHQSHCEPLLDNHRSHLKRPPNHRSTSRAAHISSRTHYTTLLSCHWKRHQSPMASKRTAAVLLLPALASLVIAQQGVLVDGNSQLPSCAQSCPLLQQAATACTSGGFSCLCTSAFLVNLKNTATGASVCAGSCQQSDAQQVVTWYVYF